MEKTYGYNCYMINHKTKSNIQVGEGDLLDADKQLVNAFPTGWLAV